MQETCLCARACTHKHAHTHTWTPSALAVGWSSATGRTGGAEGGVAGISGGGGGRAESRLLLYMSYGGKDSSNWAVCREGGGGIASGPRGWSSWSPDAACGTVGEFALL